MTMVSMMSVVRVRVHWSPWIVGWNVRVAGGGGSRSPWIVGGWVIAGSWCAMGAPWIMVVAVLGLVRGRRRNRRCAVLIVLVVRVAGGAGSGGPWVVGWSVRVAGGGRGSPGVTRGRRVRVARSGGRGSPWVLVAEMARSIWARGT